MAGEQARVPDQYGRFDGYAWTGIAYDSNYPVGTFPSPIPLPPNPRVEGDPGSAWDRHVLVVDSNRCEAYELISFNPLAKLVLGVPWAAAGAKIALGAGAGLVPASSTTVSGAPLLAGLIRLDEVRNGSIDHVIGAASGKTSSRNTHVWPAINGDGTDPHPDAIPVGTRLRLKNDVPVSHLTGQAAIVARALKVHGLLITDSLGSGAGLGFSAENVEDGWDETNLATLAPLLRVGAFEVVDQTPMMVSPDSWAVR